MGKRDYKDRDLILTIFTSTHGKLSLLARGAKRSFKRFGGKLDLLYYLSIIIEPSTKFWSIREVSLIDSFPNITCDLKRLSCACHFVDIVRKSLLDGQVNEQLFELLKKALFALNDQPSSRISKIQTRFYNYYLVSEGIKHENSILNYEQFKGLFESYTGVGLNRMYSLR